MAKKKTPTSAECIAEYQGMLSEYREKAIELTTDNPDWMRINIGLAGWYEIEVLMAQAGMAGGMRGAVALRSLASVIYAMGYNHAVSELIVGPTEEEKKN